MDEQGRRKSVEDWQRGNKADTERTEKRQSKPGARSSKKMSSDLASDMIGAERRRYAWEL